MGDRKGPPLIRVFDLIDHRLVSESHTRHFGPVRSIALLRAGDRSLVVSGDSYRWIDIWDLQTGQHGGFPETCVADVRKCAFVRPGPCYSSRVTLSSRTICHRARRGSTLMRYVNARPSIGVSRVSMLETATATAFLLLPPTSYLPFTPASECRGSAGPIVTRARGSRSPADDGNVPCRRPVRDPS